MKKDTKVKKTFNDYDLLDLSSFAKSLKDHVVAEYPYVDGSLVISLNGRFGCGKTCFLEMFENYLEKENYKSIYVNSWRNDFFDEPIITLLSELIDYTNNNASYMGKILKSLLATLTSSVVAGNQLVRKTTGLDFKEISELTVKEIEKRDIKLGNAIFKEYNS